MFVPLTKGGVLKRKLTEMEQGLRQPTKVKYIEQMGHTVAEQVVMKDPWAKGGCGRPKCVPCATQPGKCMSQGALYALACDECDKKGLKTLYHGESAHTPYDRGLNHADMIRRKDASHPIVEHFHSDQPNDEDMPYEMKVVRHERKNLYRQAGEGQLICNFKGDTILNGRGDWGQNLPPKLIVEETGVKRKERVCNAPSGGAKSPPPPS